MPITGGQSVGGGIIAVGTEAPDFELKDQHGQAVRLSSFRGVRNVLVVFYPLAFTRTCHGELCALRDSLNDFVNDAVQTLTISVDSSPTHRVWAEQQGYQFPLLADFWPHGAVARIQAEVCSSSPGRQSSQGSCLGRPSSPTTSSALV